MQKNFEEVKHLLKIGAELDAESTDFPNSMGNTIEPLKLN